MSIAISYETRTHIELRDPDTGMYLQAILTRDRVEQIVIVEGELAWHLPFSGYSPEQFKVITHFFQICLEHLSK